MTNAFEPTTSAVNEIIGTIDGVKIRVLDTPGLRSSLMEQAFNRKILSSIKKFMKKFPPDVVLYVDRLDTEDKDLNDLPLLKSITSSLQSISQTVGDLRLMNPNLIIQYLLLRTIHCVERTEMVRRSIWSKKAIWLSTPFPTPTLLVVFLLQSFTHPKLSTDQGGENVDSDIELGNMTNTDEENDDVYDQLPAFKPLRRSDIAKLSKEQRTAYFEEYDYRVKLLQKKEWRQELKRLREMKKSAKMVGMIMFMWGRMETRNLEVQQLYQFPYLTWSSHLPLMQIILLTALKRTLLLLVCFPQKSLFKSPKGKNEFNIHFDSSVSSKHGENGSTMAGVSITFSGKNVATGLKIEDQIAVGRRLVLVGSTGAIRSQNDAAYGASFEIRLKENDFPIGQDQATLGLSLMKWRNDFALMGLAAWSNSRLHSWVFFQLPSPSLGVSVRDQSTSLVTSSMVMFSFVPLHRCCNSLQQPVTRLPIWICLIRFKTDPDQVGISFVALRIRS
ncbi:Translocase of chloroplast 159, chloroplastic [Vitis vinifera]|uniref:Translocase of chloroplast 159, chloroplastic n=1 Tax=Vitis vinifera TaxID=29760 RepID=A0A438F6I0_VITVI|nr:Translocase of chloroplast 159, chloroplastic [Vitis vinifera]